MAHLSIRDLQKISGEAIQALPGPTAVKSGERTVGLLVPLKKADPARLKAALARVYALRQERDPKGDEAFLAANPDIDPTDWTEQAVQALMREWRER